MSRTVYEAITARIEDKRLFVTAPASYAQARIWLDERIRFDPDKPQVAIYNMPMLYRLCSGCTLSVGQLRRALQLVVAKHLSLRTSLVFDTQKNELMQRVVDLDDENSKPYAVVESTYATEEQLSDIMHEEKRNPRLFDLARGGVFRCHFVYLEQKPPTDVLSDKDAIIFNFHHALFDYPSMHVFLHDLDEAYTTERLLPADETALRYLDCKPDRFFRSIMHCSSLRFRRHYRAANANDRRAHVLA